MKTVFQSLSHIDSGDVIDLWNDFDFEPLFLSIDPINQWFAVTPDRQRTVKCHNKASAVAYATGRLPELKDDGGSLTYPCKAFVSPTNQYYVEFELKTEQHNGSFLLTTVRIDDANRASALHYVRNGIDTTIVAASFLKSFNQ